MNIAARHDLGNAPGTKQEAIVYVVDDDVAVRRALSTLLRSVDLQVETYGSTHDFLSALRHDVPSCLILDVRLRDRNGLAFHQELKNIGMRIPVLFITGHGDLEMGVKAMKAGATDFFAKPFRDQDMLDAVVQALDLDKQRLFDARVKTQLRLSYEALSTREREILRFVIAGLMNKQIAVAVGLSEVTVKVHRGHIMRKMNAQTLPDLARMAVALGIEPSKNTLTD
ncbi:response regulator transcription factor [Paraburkholderia guartelaensis]|uniref:response regulator transcription factor n=1 Tax=Paraburkholderia guartelaensis TaxID=2546446 RepID=UPI002AB6B3AE|nr:response regulator [Paraburkholderia guartelaensis]